MTWNLISDIVEMYFPDAFSSEKKEFLKTAISLHIISKIATSLQSVAKNYNFLANGS